MECILATNYFDSVQMLHPPMFFSEASWIHDRLLWVVSYPRVTLKLGWKPVAKTHHNSTDGLIWANNEHIENRAKRNLWWGVVACVILPAKKQVKEDTGDLYYICQQQ